MEARYFGKAPTISETRLWKRLACALGLERKDIGSQVVKAVAGRRAGYPYRALGFVELKGLPEPLDTFEVGWDPTPGHSAMPRPSLDGTAVTTKHILTPPSHPAGMTSTKATRS